MTEPLQPLPPDEQDDENVEERFPDADEESAETPNPDPEDPDPVLPPPRSGG